LKKPIEEVKQMNPEIAMMTLYLNSEKSEGTKAKYNGRLFYIVLVNHFYLILVRLESQNL